MAKFVNYQDVMNLPTVKKSTDDGGFVEEYIPKSMLSIVPESEVVPISFIRKWVELHKDFVPIRAVNYMLNDYLLYKNNDEEILNEKVGD